MILFATALFISLGFIPCHHGNQDVRVWDRIRVGFTSYKLSIDRLVSQYFCMQTSGINLRNFFLTFSGTLCDSMDVNWM